MNKYFLYARKSSESEDRQILSIDSQVKELKLLAKKLGIEIIHIFTESMSAKSPGRPIFTQMMERIYGGEAGGIICWKLDRLARNPVDGGSIIWAIKQSNIEIVTPSQIYNQAGENSFMMYVEFGMAQKFVDDLSKNVKRGLKEKAEKGWLPSGAKPGYKNDKYAEKGNKTILKDSIRFPLIRKAWEIMLTGQYSPPYILNKLNNEWGYRTPKHKRIGGKPMARSMIYKIFTDPFYFGEFEYPLGSGIWHKGKHEPVITRDEFDRTQMLLGKKGKMRLVKHDFDFIGLMTCGSCGASVTAEEKWQIICSNCKFKFHKGKNTENCKKCHMLIADMKNPKILHYIFYHCTKRKDPNCSQKGIEIKNLEKQIDQLLSQIQISERFKNWALKYLNELNDKEVDDRNSVMDSLQAAHKDITQRIDNLVKLKIAPQNSDGSLLSDDEYREQKETLLHEKRKLDDNLKNTNNRIESWLELSEKTFEFACYAKHWFAEGDSETKREIFSSLGQNLILKDKIVRVELEKPLKWIEEIRTEIPTISQMLEPKEKIDVSIQVETLWYQNPYLLRG